MGNGTSKLVDQMMESWYTLLRKSGENERGYHVKI